MNLMIASLSKSTLVQYNVTYKLWWNFCKDNNLNTYEHSVSSVLVFLTQQFDKGSAYGSLNSHRSALSLLLGGKLGTDARIKRLLKGAYKLRPSVPKYASTWDPKIVLNLISTWYPNRSLSLEKISKKLAVLLALCTGRRVQKLSLVKLHNISTSPSGIKIVISDIIKTSAPGREQPILFLPYFEENKSICPATALEDYLFVTKDLRLTISEPNINNKTAT